MPDLMSSHNNNTEKNDEVGKLNKSDLVDPNPYLTGRDLLMFAKQIATGMVRQSFKFSIRIRYCLNHALH